MTEPIGDEYRRPGDIGYRVTPRDQPSTQSASGRAVKLGDFEVQFNPVTGDLVVTSRTGMMWAEPIMPGVLRLSPERRSGTPGVGV